MSASTESPAISRSDADAGDTVICYRCRRTVRRTLTLASTEYGIVVERKRACSGLLARSCARITRTDAQRTTAANAGPDTVGTDRAE